MKILIGYNGGEHGRMALLRATDYARVNNAFVYIMSSMEGGRSEKQSDITETEINLEYVGKFMEHNGLEYNAFQSVRGLSAGEDIVKFAKEKKVDQIFMGIKKKSATEKALLGSTARYVILNASCAVTTIKFKLEDIGAKELLKGRCILAVDDEPDILETVEELLDMCILDTASSFDDARNLLEEKQYDIAIIDIMGVQGYELLELTRKKKIPTMMLTAHTLTPEALIKSIKKGADSYIPKGELPNLLNHIEDVLQAHIKGEQGIGVWFSKLKPSFDKSFGKGWRDKERAFWESYDDK